MITRIYIHNYKCFSNFEYRPGANELLLGRNGSGKSSVFDVLRLVRELVYDGASVAEMDEFGPETLTRWDRRDAQTVGLEVAGNGGAYTYSLVVEHAPDRRSRRIGREELHFAQEGSSGSCLFRRERDEGRLYRDDASEGPEVRIDWNRSGLSSIHPRRDNTLLSWFKERLGRTHCVRVVPHLMSALTDTEDDAPTTNLSNYASWYRHLNQEEPRVREALHESLSEVIDGFSTLSLKRVTAEGRRLCADLNTAGSPFTYDLDQLSDGQRALIALYTLSAYAREFATAKSKPTTLCIDEPENYVALFEVQPWIREIEDCADGEHAQVLIASHHPSFINRYAHTGTTLFHREGGGHVQTKPFTAESGDGLLPSEIVARGWEEDE